MYAVLRKQDRLMLPNGKTMAIKPVRAGRDGGASSEAKELDAIDWARRTHAPIYLIQHANGTIYDVLTDKTAAVNFRDATATRTPGGKLNVKLFEQKNGCLFPIH